MGLLVGGLTALANRTRSSRDVGRAVEPVKHTEEERAAALAELDSRHAVLDAEVDRAEARVRKKARIFDRRIDALLDAFEPNWREPAVDNVHDFTELRELVDA